MKHRSGNVLTIKSPGPSGTYLEVRLNGKKIRDLISMKIEVPSGKDTPLIKVRLEFYAGVDARMIFKKQWITLSHPSVLKLSEMRRAARQSTELP